LHSSKQELLNAIVYIKTQLRVMVDVKSNYNPQVDNIKTNFEKPLVK